MGGKMPLCTPTGVVWDSSNSGVFPTYLLPTKKPHSILSSLLGGRSASSVGLWSMCSQLSSYTVLHSVAVILRATTKQGEGKVNCQDVSQSAQGRDKSCQTYQSLQSILELVSFVQGPVEVSQWIGERSQGGQVRLLLRKLQGLYTCCAIYLLSYYRASKSKQ